jgi:hypothetical protein
MSIININKLKQLKLRKQQRSINLQSIENNVARDSREAYYAHHKKRQRLNAKNKAHATKNNFLFFTRT